MSKQIKIIKKEEKINEDTYRVYVNKEALRSKSKDPEGRLMDAVKLFIGKTRTTANRIGKIAK